MDKKYTPNRISEWLGIMLICALAMLFGSSMILRGMNPHGTGTLILNLFLKILTFGLPVFVVAYCVRCGAYRLPEMGKTFSGHQTVLIVISSIGSIICLQMLYGSVFPMTINDLGITSQTKFLTLCLLFLVHVAAPALLEELFFRGVFMRSLMVFRSFLALLLSSLMFALMHISLYAFPITFVCGFIIGAAYLSTGSLIATMTIHLSCNAFWFFSAVFSAKFPTYAGTVMQGLFGICVLMLAAGLPFLKLTFGAIFDEDESKTALPSSHFWSVPMVLFIAMALAANLFFGG